MKPYSLGIIGTGAIGVVHAKTAATLSGVRLAAVCDVDIDRATALAYTMGARAYASNQHLAEVEQLDGVVICTPPVTHPHVAEFYLERGIDVLCEKPLAVDGIAARAMVSCAQRHGRLLMLASKFRYVDDVIAARRFLHDGTLGRIRHAEIVFASNVDMRSRWNADPTQSGGGVVIDNGTHAVDICRYLFGSVASVAAVAYTRKQKLAVEDSAYLYLVTENGTGVTVDITWSLEQGPPYFIRIFGDHGRLAIGWSESKLSRGPTGITSVIGSGYAKHAAFAAVQRDFVESSQTRKHPHISIDDALASVDVIDVAYASIRNGGRVPVNAEEVAV